jgi:hypothetical protein
MARTTLLLFFCIISLHLCAQNLTGRWIGSFIANEDALMNSFTYQIEIKENSNHQITAQTITQKTDQFYVSAFARGNHSIRTNLVQINETSFDEIKIANELEACLMTNFLIYKNIDGHEILEGSYMSTAVNGKKNCGSGKVFLEKAPSLLIFKKNKNDTKLVEAKKVVIIESPKITKTPKPNQATSVKMSNTFAAKKSIPFTDKTITKVQSNPTAEEDIDEVIVETTPATSNQVSQNTIHNQPINLPWVLVGRENKLVKKIITNSKKISIDLFDNGTIDNDTVIVYDNKQLLVNKQRLSYKSIHLEFNFTENMREHEVIIVAHNMGTVPPNTALLLYKDGKNRQEYFITSTNKINAKLLIVYEPSIPD